MNNCDFIDSLTAEQKAELRKLLDEESEHSEQYRVEIEFWDEAKTKIKSLVEYQGTQPHGKYIRWYENGNKEWETNYHQDQKHGKDLGWYENGNKYWEAEYKHGKRIK